jgi:hypothetical protein
VNRCMVFLAAASDGASIHETLRDANGRLWPAGPARALPSTEATTIASTAIADGQMGESVDPNARVHPASGAGQDSRGGGLYARTRLTGAQRPSGRRHASPVDWPVAAPTSTNFARTQYWQETTAWRPNDESRLAEAREHAWRPVESTPVRCADTWESALPGASPQRETALSDARRPEHRAPDARRTRAQQAGAVEARIVFDRGGTRVPASEGGIRGVQRRAAGSPRGIVRGHATPAETAAKRPEKRAAQASSSAKRLTVSRGVEAQLPTTACGFPLNPSRCMGSSPKT